MASSAWIFISLHYRISFIQGPSFKVIGTLYSSFAVVACFGKKLLVGCTIYLGIEDVYMEVVGKEMTWSISIPMSRDWKRDVIWFTS